MPDIDPEKFLNTPIYDFDFQFMIGDVKDFLEFSENNIDLQYQRELQANEDARKILDALEVWGKDLLDS